MYVVENLFPFLFLCMCRDSPDVEVLDKEELNRDEDLALADRTMGPLVLPGPSLSTLTQPEHPVEGEIAEVEGDPPHTGECNTVLVGG